MFLLDDNSMQRDAPLHHPPCKFHLGENGKKEYNVKYSFNTTTKYSDIVKMTEGSTHWFICNEVIPQIDARRANGF